MKTGLFWCKKHDVIRENEWHVQEKVLPNHVHLVVPRIDVEHGADADHVVAVLTQVLHILVFDRHVWKQLKVLGRSLEHRVSGVETIHQQSSAPVPSCLRQWNTWMLMEQNKILKPYSPLYMNVVLLISVHQCWVVTDYIKTDYVIRFQKLNTCVTF